MQSILHGIGAAVFAVFAVLGGLFGPPRTITVAPQSAIVIYGVVTPSTLSQNAVVPTAPTSAPNTAPTSTAISTTTAELSASPAMVFPTTTPNLLPQVTLKSGGMPATKSSVVASLAPAPEPAPKLILPPTPVVLAPLTAEQLLNQTTASFRETHDGPYEAFFTTQTGSAPLIWNFTNTKIGGSGSMPAFSVSYTCDPSPEIPSSDSADQNPLFTTRSQYDCVISLTPLSGGDRRTQSKHFAFTTPSGQLIVTQPPSMGTLLADDEDNGGFTFNNQDGHPVTVTSITIDASYQYLTTAYGPLILRILDPVTENPLGDYHLETTVTDPTTQFSSETTVTIPLAFIIPGTNQKMLPLQVLGVHRMLVANTTPQITLTIKNITTDPSDIKPVLGAAQISWSCNVVIGGYDPNATTGPMADGSVCRN